MCVCVECRVFPSSSVCLSSHTGSPRHFKILSFYLLHVCMLVSFSIFSYSLLAFHVLQTWIFFPQLLLLIFVDAPMLQYLTQSQQQNQWQLHRSMSTQQKVGMRSIHTSLHLLNTFINATTNCHPRSEKRTSANNLSFHDSGLSF